MQSTLSMSSVSIQDALGMQGAARAQAKGSSLDSADLLRGQKAIQILHNGSVYRLQATKLGKLILTK